MLNCIGALIFGIFMHRKRCLFQAIFYVFWCLFCIVHVSCCIPSKDLFYHLFSNLFISAMLLTRPGRMVANNFMSDR